MRTAPGFPKHIMTIPIPGTTDATKTISFKAAQDMTILEIRHRPTTITAGTVTMSVEDDDVALTASQDSTTLAENTTRTLTVGKSNQRIARNSKVDIVLTLSDGADFDDALLEVEWME